MLQVHIHMLAEVPVPSPFRAMGPTLKIPTAPTPRGPLYQGDTYTRKGQKPTIFTPRNKTRDKMPLKEQQNHCDKGKTKGGFHKLVENTQEQVLEKENGTSQKTG